MKIPQADAEALVRLDRRIAAQSAVSQMPQLTMAIPLADPMADQVMADLGLTDDALAVNNQASMDPMAALGANSGADFNNADISAVLDQTMGLANSAAQNLSNAPDATGNSVDNIFGDLNMDLGQSSQQMLAQGGAGMSLDGNAQNDAEDDIFAGLAGVDMGDLNDDDFNFS